MAASKTDTRHEHDTATANEHGRDRMAQATGAAHGVVDTARGAASDIVAQLPGAAAQTKAAVDEATRQMQSTSDVVLTLGSTFAFGVTLGLFLSGTNRLAVAVALVPAVAMAMTVVDRRSRGSFDMSAG